MIRFIWARLVHAPLPSKLLYVDSCSVKDLVGSDTDVSSAFVRMFVYVSFDTGSFSPSFSYKGRSIATPFLSAVGLEDPVKDRRLLGNCVYWPGSSRLSPCSFRDFFTGVDVLGSYSFQLFSPGSGIGDEKYAFSQYVVVSYYVVDPYSERRISTFLDSYEQAKFFAEQVLWQYGDASKDIFLVNAMVRSCIRYLKHPMGIFASVNTMTGSFLASYLLFVFRRILACGGDGE